MSQEKTAVMYGKWTLLICLLCAPCWAGQLQKGVNLTLWSQDVNVDQLAASLDNLKALGADSISVNVWWFQDDINSDVIQADFTHYSASDDSVRTVVAAIHERGMAVVLKPMVDLRNDPTHWRGNIVGDEAWFTGPGGYGAFMDHWADIASETSAEMLVVGTELVNTASEEARWRTVVTDVRSRYTGPLVYAALHGGSSAATSANIGWWDALDFIGLDAYYPLTSKTAPSLGELQAAWQDRAAMIGNWRNSLPSEDQKPILFTEVGYRSWDGTNKAPWSGADKSSANVDQQEQADCYEALLSQLWGKEPWLEGLYWWNWEVDPHPTWEVPNWYPIQDKPAEAVLRNYYAPEALTPGDANGDGVVDAADYIILKQNFGSSTAIGEDGDFNRNGTVDWDDLQTLIGAFGAGAASPGAPEPATVVVLALGSLAMIRRRRKWPDLDPQQALTHAGGHVKPAVTGLPEWDNQDQSVTANPREPFSDS